VRVTADGDAPSEAVADALASMLDGAAVVCCGDYSADRGSGSVPAFLAHKLESAQALGLTGLAPREQGGLIAQRRLDGGRREHLQVTAPAVISVEPGVARLRRAPLPGLLGAGAVAIEVAEGGAARRPRVTVTRTAPYRPRPKSLPPPRDPLPRARLLALTGALTERTPPRVVRAPCDEAADELMAYLKDQGYLT
jgi:electron transfer flavoprotein beta subunit